MTCVHYCDGNGRVGRLWHTLLLSKWNENFAWIPIESIIHDNQQEYYDAFNKSNNECESTCFIEFMLSVIKSALEQVVSPKRSDSNKKDIRHNLIKEFLLKNEFISNADVRALLFVSSATANRILSNMVEEGIIVRCFVGKHHAYRLP